MGQQHLVIDLIEYVNVLDVRGVTPSQRLATMTGPIPTNEFLSVFSDELANLIVHEDDIIRTDDYCNNDLYFVFDRNGKRHVIQTPSNYMLAEQAFSICSTVIM